MPSEGSSTAEVVFTGEGQGAEEDWQGRPFVGTAGKILNQALSSAGFTRENVYITNIVRCSLQGIECQSKKGKLAARILKDS